VKSLLNPPENATPEIASPLWATVWSVLAHPIWMPLYLSGLAWASGIPDLLMYPKVFRLWFTAALGLVTVLLPLAALVWMKSAGLVSSWQVPLASQRRGPYAVQILCLGTMLWLIKGLNLSPWLTAPLILALFLVVWAWLWLPVTKVSAHGLGMGALTGMAVALFLQGADWSFQDPALAAAVLPVLFLLSCVVSAARLALNAHSPWELLHGWLAGLMAFGVGLPWMT